MNFRRMTQGQFGEKRYANRKKAVSTPIFPSGKAKLVSPDGLREICPTEDHNHRTIKRYMLQIAKECPKYWDALTSIP